MLKIRLQRIGRKNDPSYRVVVTEHTSAPQAGKNVAVVGSYHPKTKQTSIDAEAVSVWLSRGAQASGTVHNLLISQGVIEGKKVNVLGKKTPIVKEKEEEASAKEEPAPKEAPTENTPDGETPTAAEEKVAETPTEEEAAPKEEPEKEPDPKEETPAPASV